MSTDITPYTTNQEVQDIIAYYTDSSTGAVDYDAIATAIETNDTSAGTIEDLITVYVSGQGQLPSVMMAPEAYPVDLDDPAYAHLWTEEVVDNLEYLGQMNSSLATQVASFLNYGDSIDAVDSSLLGEVEDYLSNYGIEGEEADEVADQVYDLFASQDLSDIMSLFISLGNPGIALLMYTAYGLGPQMQELQEAAVEVMEDSSEEMEDILDDIQDLDPEDLSAQYDSQALSQQLNVVSTVISTMSEFIQNAQDIVDEMIELASNLSEQTSRTTQSIIRNIGS
ncbi:MAG: hypothetical protein HY541_09480 [Deltaproteobacteria bacterium]|nr:hypothetical protein [Deltaproteobacteria bacterium]